MKIVIVLAVLAAACRPEKVVIPHEHSSRPVAGEVNNEVGSTAPESSVVTAHDGSSVELAEAWAKQRVVLVFYMGHWCPHCQKQLGDLNAHEDEFKGLDTTVVAVSTDTPEDAGALVEKLSLKFPVFSDPDLKVAGKWGVADYGASIAKPATFVIQPGGAITFKKIGENQADRPTVEQVLDASKPPAHSAE